jgi:hypothetical protein
MPLIERPTIEADFWIVTADDHDSFARVVAIDAERLELTDPERIPVSVMRFDVIGDPGGDCHATLEAHPAQRLIAQLQSTATTPALVLVPLPPWCIGVHGWLASVKASSVIEVLARTSTAADLLGLDAHGVCWIGAKRAARHDRLFLQLTV